MTYLWHSTLYATLYSNRFAFRSGQHGSFEHDLILYKLLYTPTGLPFVVCNMVASNMTPRCVLWLYLFRHNVHQLTHQWWTLARRAFYCKTHAAGACHCAHVSGIHAGHLSNNEIWRPMQGCILITTSSWPWHWWTFCQAWRMHLVLQSHATGTSPKVEEIHPKHLVLQLCHRDQSQSWRDPPPPPPPKVEKIHPKSRPNGKDWTFWSSWYSWI